jgi:outer membrane protein TolC
MTLQDAECIALEYNKQLLIAEQNTEQASDRKNQAISRWLPKFIYHAEYRHINPKEAFFNIFGPPANLATFANEGYSSILQMNQPLFSTDLLFNLQSKFLQLDATRYAQASTTNELLRAVRDSYFAVIYQTRRLQIERENIDFYSYALQQEQGRLDAGSSTPFEVNQFKAAVTNALSLYYNTLKDLKSARNAFVITLGIDPLLEPQIFFKSLDFPFDSIPEIAIKLQELDTKYSYRSDTFPSTDDILNQINRLSEARKLTLFSKREVKYYINQALCQRPDLLAKKMEVGVAEKNVQQKQGTYLPTVHGYARYSYNDNYLGPKPFFDEKYNWAIGVSLDWNLFDSFLREFEIKEAKSIRTAAAIGYEKELQEIEVEIRNSLYQLEEAMLSYLSATQSVYVAEQASGQARDKNEFGRIPPLDYRDSVNRLYQARNLQNQASFQLMAAYYELRYATGQDVSCDSCW